jgi:hypothetical protein
MPEQIPTIGRVVHFRLSKQQAEDIEAKRSSARVPTPSIGAQMHVGNPVGEGAVVPMFVTGVWPEEYSTAGCRLADHPEGTKYEGTIGVNGQAFLDGNDSLWVCSAPQHSTLPGCWFWPPRA